MTNFAFYARELYLIVGLRNMKLVFSSIWSKAVHVTSRSVNRRNRFRELISSKGVCHFTTETAGKKKEGNRNRPLCT